jgi:hypothetical protein
MADDVKIKFGGDFTDVSKGANDAVGKAGASLGSWFSDFSKSTEASVLSALSLSSIFGKLVEGMSAVLKSSKEIDTAFQRFGKGGSSSEFQLIARYGQEVGVSMEAVGRTMNYFNKVQESAKKGSDAHKAALMGLNFTEKEAKSGKISAIEVLRRLSDEYDKTGNAALSGQRAVQLFGLQGEQLSAIYKNGKISLDEFVKATKTMSDESIKQLANTERKIERFKKSLGEIFYKKPLEQAGHESEMFEAQQVASETFRGIEGGATGGTAQQDARTVAQQIYSALEGEESAIRHSIEVLNEFTDSIFRTTQEEETAKLAIIELNKMMTKAREEPKKEGPPLLEAVRVMATSSLQAIGGGDVNSILSGTYQSSMLDAATKTADNTGKLLDKENNKPAIKPTNVAK